MTDINETNVKLHQLQKKSAARVCLRVIMSLLNLDLSIPTVVAPDRARGNSFWRPLWCGLGGAVRQNESCDGICDHKT